MAITGIGINSTNADISQEKERMASILSEINQTNKSVVDLEEEERLRKEQEAQDEAKRRGEELLDEANRERYLREQEAKRLRDEEESREREEEENTKKRNPFYSTLKKMEGKSKKKNSGSTESSDGFEDEDEEEETETYGAFLLRTAMEKGGDTIRMAKEAIGAKKHALTKSVANKLSQTGGFTVSDGGEYNPSEEFAKRQEQKEAKRAEKEAKKQELAEKKRIQKEEQKKAEEAKKLKEDLKKKELAEKKEAERQKLAEEKLRQEELRYQQAQAQKNPVAQQISAPQATPTGKPADRPLTIEEYNAHLSSESRELKDTIVKEHVAPETSITERAVNEIQKMRNVVAVIIASADMNHLFIFHEPATFVDLAGRLDRKMNYSYIYVITTTAPVYFGADTCYHNLTELFNRIREVILRYGHANRNVLLKIDGINIFKNIHLDV